MQDRTPKRHLQRPHTDVSMCGHGKNLTTDVDLVNCQACKRNYANNQAWYWNQLAE